jgi:hypothetical protein
MRYVERERRYPSDLTDEQWAVIEPMLPLPKWMAGRNGIRVGPLWTPSCTVRSIFVVMHVVIEISRDS